MTQNVAASIMARLLNIVKAQRADSQHFLDRYGRERFLYRLGESRFKEKCILKGASLLELWMDEPYRGTRDIDLVAHGANDEGTVRQVITTICKIPCPDDGIAFDIGTLRISATQVGEVYPGQRATFTGYLGTAKCNIQVDFRFGDAVVPGPEDAMLPTLIEGLPTPRLLVYQKVTTVAEKFEAMVHLGSRNSRMKDFSDVWALSEAFPFHGEQLQAAISSCFARRGTSLTVETPEALTLAFYSSTQRHNYWMSYLNRGDLLRPPPSDFEQIGERIRNFLGPVRDSIINGENFQMYWPPAGPWRRRNTDNGG